MINIVIAFDNQNKTLGQYFDDCQKDIVALLEEQKHLVKSCSKITSTQCNAAYIDTIIPQLNSKPFIFIAYTHGIDDGVRCNGSSFVSVDNCHHFVNSLFYSTACLIGKILASELIVKGCKAFIGFKEESEVFQNTSHRQTFIECDNYALKVFMISDATIGQAFDSMKNYYTYKIDRFVELGEDPFFIGALTANREALVCLGNKNLKKEDIFVFP
jgi:hypothetical protein